MRDKIFTVIAIIIVISIYIIGKNAIDKGEIDLYYDENKVNNETTIEIMNNEVIVK